MYIYSDPLKPVALLTLRSSCPQRTSAHPVPAWTHMDPPGLECLQALSDFLLLLLCRFRLLLPPLFVTGTLLGARAGELLQALREDKNTQAKAPVTVANRRPTLLQNQNQTSHRRRKKERKSCRVCEGRSCPCCPRGFSSSHPSPGNTHNIRTLKAKA